MSLINEALRKARQAASEHDAKQAEDIFRPRKAYPSRRTGSGGWLVTAMIALGAAVIGASAAWWLFGDRQTPSPETVMSEVQPGGPTAPIAAPDTAAAQTEVQTEVDTIEAAAEEVPMTQSPQTEDRPAEVETDAEARVVEPAPPQTAAADVAAASGEREYVMEADLGDVVLSLGFIVARTENPFAEINGVEVYLGSEIEGFVVEAIEAERVVLRDNDGPLVLRVP